MVDLAMSIFEFLTKFVIFWHRWHPWVCVRSDLKQIWAIPPTVQEFAARYAVIWVVPNLTFENDKQVQVQFCAFSSKWHGAV